MSGRPTKLDAATADAIVQAVAAGMTRTHAAMKAGVSYGTLKRWLRAGRAGGDPAAVDLLDRLKRAAAEAIAKHLGNITTAADNGTWTASAWFLERTHPATYSANRKEVRELLKAVSDLTARLAHAETRRKRAKGPAPSTSEAAVISRGTAWSAASAISATSGKFFQQSATMRAASAVPGSPSQER